MAYIPERANFILPPGVQRHTAARPWLPVLKDHIEATTMEAAAEIWKPLSEDQKPYYNYRLEHILQVERDALIISSVERCDMDVLLAAVWTHDRFQPQFEGENHAERAALWARDYLKFIRFPEHRINDVCQAIRLHNVKSMDIPEDLREARILWDADHVSRLGPGDIVNYLFCHSAEDFLADLPNNSKFPAGAITVRDFIPLMMERRPQMYRADWFYYDETRRLARERISAVRTFLDCLEKQTGLAETR